MPQFSTDEQYWHQLRAGDESALAELVRRFHGPLVSYARKFVTDSSLIEDSVQELFVDIWVKRQTLGDTTAVRPYLLASLRRKLVRSLHRVRWTIATSPEGLELPFLSQFSVEDAWIEDETHQKQLRRLNYLINRLPARQREAVYLKFYQNLTNEQIAQVMHVGYQPATNLIYRAIAFLRQHWHEEFSPMLLIMLFS